MQRKKNNHTLSDAQKDIHIKLSAQFPILHMLMYGKVHAKCFSLFNRHQRVSVQVRRGESVRPFLPQLHRWILLHVQTGIPSP